MQAEPAEDLRQRQLQTDEEIAELGQPLHAFDDAKLAGAIHVRYPTPNEALLLLNEQNIKPAADTLLIADESRALALAGIMGGADSSVTATTRDVFLESAFFVPAAIAGKARNYGFSSDASHRFERGVDLLAALLAEQGIAARRVSDANTPAIQQR